VIPVDPAAALSSAATRVPSGGLGLSSPIINLDGVGQTFVSSDGSKVHALEDISLAIYRHEFISLIGPSGCGKSTILSLLAGLLEPSAAVPADSLALCGALHPERR
jgi:ABC-type glutathione transport system ATPase component